MLEVLLYAVGVVVFLVALMLSIALHELGHLYAAKAFGCRVSKYMVGFGRTIWSRRIGETEYGVKLVPLGGFVKIIGMLPPGTGRERRISRGLVVEEAEPVILRRSGAGPFSRIVSRSRAVEFGLVEPSDRDRLFYKLPPGKKALVMLAGPAVNIALAFACLLSVHSIHGVRTTEPTGRAVVAAVSDCVIPESEGRGVCEEGDPVSPAKASGLEPGDEIVGFNGRPVGSWEQLSGMIHQNLDREMSLVVVRADADGRTERVALTPVPTVVMDRDLDGDGMPVRVGFVGIEPESHQLVTRHGPVYTVQRMAEMTATAVRTIVELPQRVWNVVLAVAGVEERSQDGPMSVIGGSRMAGEIVASDDAGLDVGNKAAMLGMVIGSFNLFIGVFNLVPLLPLDGGHIAGAAWEGLRRRTARILRRPDPGFVDVARQLPIAYAMGLVLLAMTLVLMIGDVVVPLRSDL